MNEKNLAILARLKAQMIEEALKKESVHAPEKQTPNIHSTKKTEAVIKHKKSASYKSKRKKKAEVYPKLKIFFSFIDGGQSSKFREQNRRMIEKQENIGRNHSNFNESLHAYHGGTVTPK